jgi:hypothetical protein
MEFFNKLIARDVKMKACSGHCCSIVAMCDC